MKPWEPENDENVLNISKMDILQNNTLQALVESEKDIEVQRKDPNSPLYSNITFKSLHLNHNLLKGVYAMGFESPSKIQAIAIQLLLAYPHYSMIAQSQSGTGKTVAFVLAMLSRVDASQKYPQIICVNPTYELAIQTGRVATEMARFCPEIKLKYAVRDIKVPKGSKIADHIIIGTPGKILDWAMKRLFDLNKIKVFVLDEADVMLSSKGHQEECLTVHRLLPKTCQSIFCSATFDTPTMYFAKVILPGCSVIRLSREEELLENIKQYYVKCITNYKKYLAICNIYDFVYGQVIIFCQRKKTASWLAAKLNRDGHPAATISGELTLEERISILDKFRAGHEKVLITTNILSRGIDVAGVTLVVNFDMPVDTERKADCATYLHRIGRIGRFGKSGVVINLIDSAESMQICNEIEAHFQRKMALLDTEI